MLLSIIVPVYNVEAYLNECLDSVLSQPMPDFELIAVDDCSPDGSAEILDAYAAADDRVRVVHLDHNVGLGPARNVGMAQATGDYLMFLDSDDSLTPEALTAIAGRLATAGNPDVLIVDHARMLWDKTVVRTANAELIAELATDRFTAGEHPDIFQLLQVAWNKIYRRAFIAGLGLTFPSGFYEDTAWTHITLLSAATIATVPVVCVLYRQRRFGSILSTRSRRHFDAFDQWQLLFDHLSAHPELEHWRPLLLQRAVHHYITVLTLPNRLSAKDRKDFFVRAAGSIRANLDGRRLPLSASTEGVKTWLLMHGRLRVLDLVWQVSRFATDTRTEGTKRARQGKRLLGKARNAAGLVHYQRELRKPLDPDLAVYSALWDRGVTGNPAAIYDAMRTVAPQMRGVWVVKEDAVPGVPPGIDVVRPRSRRFFESMARATYFINDVNFPDYVVKRPGQVHVQTQHGTPLKHMGIDLMAHPAAAKGMSFSRLLARADKWDVNLSSNRFSSLVWQRAFPSHFATLEAGYPRNDVLVNATAEQVAAARLELGIGPGKIAVLFAPTHRDTDRHLVIRADVRTLAESLAPDFVLVVRAHYFYQWMPELDRLAADGLLVNASRHPSVERLMLAADVLVTDYSSIMFDFANLDRPMVSFVPDWETYRDVRGVYFDLLGLPPGPVAQDPDALVEVFRSGAWDGKGSAQARARFRAEFCGFDDGRAAERVARVVFRAEPPLPIVPLADRIPPPRPDSGQVQELTRKQLPTTNRTGPTAAADG